MNERRCGSCTLCCKLLPVRELAKPANTRCSHQSSKGCAVYHKPERGFPPSCGLWSCRWLAAPGTQALRRPDRAHYVVDIMPDIVRATDNQTGERIEIPVIQVWCDPAFPEAWREDKALWAYVDAQEHGMLVRFSSSRSALVFPPSIASDNQWHEVGDATIVESPSGSLLMDRMRGEGVYERGSGVSVRYQCEGCGAEIFAFGRSAVPGHGLCSTCEWLCLYMAGDLQEFWEIYQRIAVTREEAPARSLRPPPLAAR